MRETRTVHFIFNEPTFGTFIEAVNYHRNTERSQKALSDNKLLRNLTIIDHASTDTDLYLFLSDNYLLRIGIEEQIVTWSVEPFNSPISSGNTITSEIDLMLPDGSTFFWRPNDLISERYGISGIEISPWSTILSFYVRGCPDMLFSVANDLNANNLFLYYDLL